MEKELIEAIYESIAKTTEGEKMTLKINSLVKSLCDSTAEKIIPEITKNLCYHPSKVGFMWDNLAEIAEKQNWRDFVSVWGELVFPLQSLKVLGEEGIKDFFKVY